MGEHARITVTHYDNPVAPVVLDRTHAANLRFGEMTPDHARRERRYRRNLRRRARPQSTPAGLG